MHRQILHIISITEYNSPTLNQAFAKLSVQLSYRVRFRFDHHSPIQPITIKIQYKVKAAASVINTLKNLMELNKPSLMKTISML